MTPEPRTVLYLSPSSHLLGARRSLLQLVTNLDPERYRPVVAVQREGDLVDALREANIPVHIQFLGWWRKGRYMLQRPLRVRQLARLMREEDAGLVHCNEFWPVPYAVRAAERAGDLPVISHMRLSISPRRIENYALRRTERVVCVSHAAARDFEVWPDWKKRVRVIHNGVDLNAFTPKREREAVRQGLGIPEGAVVAALFGLIDERKRQLLAVEAVGKLANKLPDLHLLLVGAGGRSTPHYEQAVRARVAELGLADRVRLVPFTPEVVDFYNACDINLLISNREGFGRTIIEAGALGIPSIGARVGGIPELIENDKTGLLIDGKGDADELAGALERLARHPEDRKETGRKARELVEREFTIGRHVEKIMRLYDEVLQAPT